MGVWNGRVVPAQRLCAVQWHREIGTERMHARLHALTRYWVAQARNIRRFKLHTPLDPDALCAVSLFSTAVFLKAAVGVSLHAALHLAGSQGGALTFLAG